MSDYAIGGAQLELGKRLGKGGEGEVFAIAGDSGRAAKIYAEAHAEARRAKVEAMVSARLADQALTVAFPLEAIAGRTGFAGFTMARVTGAEPVHQLYSPGSRKARFPDADYRFVVRAALNTARAVAATHAAGCVIGDINHSGILISADATATLIDADSFQFHDGKNQYLCAVGVPDYTPPELFGMPLAETARTPNHDAFGLAVVLFQLLFVGRHPFAGVAEGGDIPLP
ncbi:MAG: hypothetical protein AAFW98_06875, partial [Pseudomonadota bacterium]